MTTAFVSIFSDLFNPVRLIGPIFDKELRVSSRRRRNYFLRFAYVVLLSLFILSVWYSAVGIRSSGSAVYRISRLSQAGRQIITTVVWFQFVAAQLIAVVMLSSSISDEVRTGTLSVLMTTPISSFQIVAGKLLSKLLQLMLLLAMSLPLLAIIRVFGGVPWDYIVASVCITLTAAVLAGAVSLLLSMTYRYAYTVILVTVMGYFVVFGVLPGLFNMLAVKGLFIFDREVTQSVIALTNPFWAFASTNAMLLRAGLPKFFSWPAHCLLMWAVTAVLIAMSVWRVRRAAVGEAFGRAGKLPSGRALENESDIHIARSPTSTGPVKRVAGSPIIWKEMYQGFLGSSKTDRTITVSLVALFCLIAVLLLLFAGRSVFPHYLMSGYYLIVMVRLAVCTAGSIAGEKEARTWPVLLMTPLTDKEIIRGKAIAAVRRNIPLLLLYLGLFCIFYIRIFYTQSGIRMFPQVLISLPIVAIGVVCSVLFVVGCGTYFGVRLRTATSAIAATACSYLTLTYLFCGMFNPLRYLIYFMVARTRTYTLYVTLVSFAVSIVPTLAQAGIGLLLARRAVRRLRRNIF